MCVCACVCVLLGRVSIEPASCFAIRIVDQCAPGLGFIWTTQRVMCVCVPLYSDTLCPLYGGSPVSVSPCVWVATTVFQDILVWLCVDVSLCVQGVKRYGCVIVCVCVYSAGTCVARACTLVWLSVSVCIGTCDSRWCVALARVCARCAPPSAVTP